MDWLNRFLDDRAGRAGKLFGFDDSGEFALVERAPIEAMQSLIFSGEGIPVDYTDGTPPATGEGVALPGAIYIDTDNGNVYRNSGTQAEPAWTQLADAA
jgi:hypothetical protein